MSLSSDVIERLPHVEGILNYLAPMADKPMNLAYDPPPGVPRSNGIPEPHRMTIYDAARSRIFTTRTNCAESIIPKRSA